MDRTERVAEELVRSLYRRLDDDTLHELCEIGQQYPQAAEVLALNAALKRELERRQAERSQA